MEVFYRYGMPKEKPLLERHKSLFSGIVIPAHIAADQKDSLPDWLSSKGIDYIIDPISFALSEKSAKLCNKDRKLRRSYRKYTESLGLGDIDFARDDLDVSRFKNGKTFDTAKITEFARLSVQSQLDMMNVDNETREFVEFFKEKGIPYPLADMLDKGHPPKFILSHGFIFESVNTDWFTLNTMILGEMRAIVDRLRVHCYLPISVVFSTNDDAKKIIDHLPDEMEGVVVWFEGFDETTASEDELRFVATTIKLLSEKSKWIMNLYGGAFFALMEPLGCSAFSCGLGYDFRRERDIGFVGGPLPLRYYIPEISKVMRPLDVEGFYKEIVPSCDCEVCRETKKHARKGEAIETEEFVRSLFEYNEQIPGDYARVENRLKTHFMHSVNKQLIDIERDGVKSFLDRGIETYDALSDKYSPPIAKKFAHHLKKWDSVIRPLL